MKRTGIYILILLVVVTLLGSMSLACKKAKSLTTGTTSLTTDSSQITNGTTPLTTGSTQITTGTTQSGNTTSVPNGLPDIADMKSLPSYRLAIMTKQVEGTPVGSISYMKFEWVRDQKAEHAWIEDANGKVTEVYIKIGDKYWMWMGIAGMGWVEQPPQTTTTTSTIPSDLASQIKQMQQDVEHSKVRFDKKGTDTVNNVSCIRYEFEYSLTTEIPNFATGGTTKADELSSGEMWIADQSGLPAVIIKSINSSEITMSGEKTVMDSEYNLTDIGANITINPPEGAMQVPTGTPTLPTGIPTLPSTTTTDEPTITTTTITTTTTTATTSATATTTTTPAVTPVLEDNFEGDWNSFWTWMDPNDDATSDFTSHSGFLRLSAPDGNDLAGVTNYDAPRLMIPYSGDFTLETLVEFNPQETYQGAGLLVWQDEDSFLRLEFGYGGMGGEEKNVVSVWGENGGLGLAGSVNLPGTTTRLELKMQRDGDQFTTWWRQVDGTWQQIGTTELSLNQTVDVGIAQITQYTSSEISVDFDYFKIFAP